LLPDWRRINNKLGQNMSKTWKLEDVSDRAKDAKYTFYLPSNEALNMLAVGDVVKVIFQCDVANDKGWSAERMWVQINKVDSGHFEGYLDNDPYYIPDIKAGDRVEFEKKHIIQMSIDDPVPSVVEQYAPRCYVTNSILRDNKKVSRLYREKPEEDEHDYSGWTLLSIDDSDEYLNDPDNWNYVSLGAVLNRDDSFIELLDSDVGSDYLWVESASLFRQI
jgi:hypothetical protein